MIINSKIKGALFTAAVCLVSISTAHAQASAVMVAPDSIVTMQVRRIKGEIFIELNFADGLQFTSAELQRRPDFEGNFTRFGYLEYDDVVRYCGHIIKKDNYPFHDSADVFYRLKLRFADGTSRVFEAVMLAASVHGG